MINIVPFDKNISKVIAADTTVEVFSFQVPANSKLYVTNFGNIINVFEAWGFITWIFKRNGIPIDPYHDIKDQIAFGAPLRTLAGVDISGADLFTIDIKNAYIDPVKCGIALKYELWEN